VKVNADFEILRAWALATRLNIINVHIQVSTQPSLVGYAEAATMPKFFCDYCDVYLTHDSMSVRKAHNNGRNHLRNVQAYYEQISSDQTQQVINSITDAYNLEGQANPLYQANLSGGFPGGPMAGMHGMGGPPMGMPGGIPAFPPPGMLMEMWGMGKFLLTRIRNARNATAIHGPRRP
jgi:hypothetical protein